QAGFSAELSIGLPHEPAVPVPAGEVQEPEGKVPLSDGGAHSLEWHPSFLQTLNQANPPKVTSRKQRAGLPPGKDAEFDQPIHVTDVDPRSLCQRFAREFAHDQRMVAAAQIQVARGRGPCRRRRFFEEGGLSKTHHGCRIPEREGEREEWMTSYKSG